MLWECHRCLRGGRGRGRGHTGLEVAACGCKNVSIDENSLWCVHPPRFTRASRECEDLCIDKIPTRDGIPQRSLHCKGRIERFWLLYDSHRRADASDHPSWGWRCIRAPPFCHNRHEKMSVGSQVSFPLIFRGVRNNFVQISLEQALRV